MTGTIELLPSGSFGVDDSFGPPSLDDMLTLGVQFESRYVCIDNALTHGKLWTKDRIKRNADAGILAMVNYEQSEGTTLGGETAGRKHGKVAADWRHYLEMPATLPIVISTDVGVTRSQYPAIADFCAAFLEESGGPIGHYHGTALCAYLEGLGLNELTWMAMATSWSPGGDPKTHETPAVHVRQKGYVLGSCDANYVRKPTPFWNFNGDPLEPTEDFMSDTQYAAVMAAIADIQASVNGNIQLTESCARVLGIDKDAALVKPIGDYVVSVLPSSVTGGVSKSDVEAIINATKLATG